MTPFEWGTQQFAELKTFQNKPGKNETDIKCLPVLAL